MSARGVLYVHSAPAALCPHVEWAVAGVVGVPVKLDWEPQPAAPNTYRAELNWQGAPGLSAGASSPRVVALMAAAALRDHRRCHSRL